MRKLALLLFIVYAHTLLAQSLVGNVVRLNPTTVPATCNTGDLRVDANAAFVLKICVANVWSAITGGGSGNATQLQGFNIATTTPTDTYVLTWNASTSAWTPQPATGGGGGTWGSITGTLSAQTDLQAALNLLAPLASPTFTGTVTAPTFAGALTGNVTGNVSGSSGSTTGNAATVTTNANMTGPITGTGNVTSITSQTGTGTKFVMDTSPVLVTPNLGTPSALVGTNLTGTGASFTAGNVTTNANLTGPVTSVGNATTITAGSVTNAMLAGSIDLTAKVTGALPILNGGTANTTKTAAFDALSPLSSTGDMLAFISSHNARVATTATTITWPYTSGGGTVPNLFSMLAPSAISGGPGAKNYLSSYNGNAGNGTFEDSTVNHWTLGLVGTLTNGLPTGTPTFGSGTSGNLSISVINSGPIAGVYSLGYVSAASTTAGNMVASDAVSIDLEDQAKVLTVKFYYNVHTGANVSNFSGTSSNSFAWAVWDATNSVWLSSAGNFCMTQSSGVGYCTGTVQTGATTASVQLVLYNANATSGATTLYLDDFSLGPQTAPMGPAMSDWVAYTPTGSWSTNTTYTGWYKRVGDSLELKVKIALAGAPTTASLTVNLPTGMTIDTTKLPATPTSFAFHSTLEGIGAAHQFIGMVFYSSTTAVAPTYVLNGSTASIASAAAITQAAPYTFANADYIELTISGIPIVGFSSNAVQSSDTDTRVVAMQVNQAAATATITSSFSLLKFTAAPTQDTHGAFSTTSGGYTCPATGFYRASVSAFMSATYANTNQALVGVGKNSTTTAVFIGINIAAAAQGALLASATGTIFCNAGDVLSPLVANTGGTPTVNTSNAAANYFDVERISGPSVIAATESVNARYHSATATLTGSLSAITYTTKDIDSHLGYSGTTYTCPTTGKYQATASIVIAATFAATNISTLALFKNGSQYDATNVYAGGIQGDANVVLTDIVPCNTGDTLVFEAASAGTGPTVVASTTGNFFAISRVGN